MAGAHLRGLGLACSLGLDLESSVSALLRGAAPAAQLKLEGFGDALHLRYRRILDEGALFDMRRVARLLPGVVRAATTGLSEAERERLPVFVGSSCFSVGLAEAKYAAGGDLPMPNCDYDYLAKLACEAIGSRGETWGYNTACSSSANALLAAVRFLETSVYDHALVLGVEYANRTSLTGFSALQILSKELRPFDRERRGMVLGEGIAAVLVSWGHAPKALRILGGANNCDTHNVTAANPDGAAVAEVLRRALESTRTKPDAVAAIKLHGTGTGTSDLAEAAGLARVFPSMPTLTGLKGHIGHTLGACGMVELALFAGALQQGVIPSTAGFTTADPALGLSPIRESMSAKAGRYVLNHLGFGGNNTVLVLEQPA